MLRSWVGLLAVALVATPANGLYEDQLGQFDWQIQHVGVPTAALYQSKRLFVSTELGVLAALNARTGAIEWRHLLAERGSDADVIDEMMLLNQRFVVTVSHAGKHVRMWQANDGGLVWDAATFATSAPDEDTGGVTAALASTKQHVVVLSPHALYFFTATAGVLEWQLSAFEMGETNSEADVASLFGDRDVSLTCLAVADPSGTTATVAGWLAPGDAPATAAAPVGGDVVVVRANVADDSVQAWVVAPPPLPTGAGPTDRWSNTPTLLVGVDDPDVVLVVLVSVTGEALATAPLSALTTSAAGAGVWNTVLTTSLLGGGRTASAPATAMPGAQQRALQVPLTDNDGTAMLAVGRDGVLARTTTLPGTIGATTSAASPPGSPPRVYVTSATRAGDGGNSVVLTAAQLLSGADGAASAQAIGSDAGSSAVELLPGTMDGVRRLTAALPHTLERRDGSVGFRVLLTTDTHAVALVQPSRASWLREEAMASLQSVAFVEPAPPVDATTSASPSEFTLEERLQLQQQRLITSATDAVEYLSSLLGSAHSKPSAAAGQMADSLLVRDGLTDETRKMFGFNKLAVCVTASGRLLGLALEDGSVAWRRELGAGARAVLTRSKQSGAARAEVMALLPSTKAADGMQHRVLLFDALTGEAVPWPADYSSPALTLPGPLAQLVPLPDPDNHNRKVFLATDAAGEVAQLLPDSSAARAQVAQLEGTLFYHILDRDSGTLQSRLVLADHHHHHQQQQHLDVSTPSALHSSVVAAAVVAAPEEEVLQVAYPNAADTVNSPAQILGDDSLLLKYLNPHLVVVVTASTAPNAGSESVLHVSLLDTVSARILHRVQHPSASGPCHVTVAENWVVYTYQNTKAHRTEMGVLSLFEGMIERFGLNPFKVPKQNPNFSSLSAPVPVVMQRSFIVPRAVTALGSTVSARGITSKSVLVGLETGQVMAMHRRMLDPRRPTGNPNHAEKSEGLMQYAHFLPLPPTMFATYNASVLGLHQLHATPAIIESTSLVLAQGIDLFFARTTPSKTFDLLAADFNRPMLLTLLGGLAIAALVVSRMDRRKKLHRAWQ